MPHIYKEICRKGSRETPRVFIETGTFKGGIPHRILETSVSRGMMHLDDTFDVYHTIEIDKTISRIASFRYKNFELHREQITPGLIHSDEQDFNFEDVGEYFGGRLKLYCGRSIDWLEKILLDLDEPACFWLDAHGGAAKYGGNVNDKTLLDELDIIGAHHIKEHVIAIDDVHLFGSMQYDKFGIPACDYSEITQDVVNSKLMQINPSYRIETLTPFNMLMLIAY